MIDVMYKVLLSAVRLANKFKERYPADSSTIKKSIRKDYVIKNQVFSYKGPLRLLLKFVVKLSLFFQRTSGYHRHSSIYPDYILS